MYLHLNYVILICFEIQNYILCNISIFYNVMLFYVNFRYLDLGHLNKYTFEYIQESALMVVDIVTRLLLMVVHLENMNEYTLVKNHMLVLSVLKHLIKE